MDYQSNLYHHGILGMKWGVRRYQNYDGSYTKKGLERYRKSEQKYREAKDSYESGKATRKDVRAAKREMSRNYDRLKKDKMADQGKDLYQQGKTITSNTQVSKLRQAGIVAGSVVVNHLLRQYADEKVAAIAASTISLGGTAINGMLAMKTVADNKRLRAYYSHD